MMSSTRALGLKREGYVQTKAQHYYGFDSEEQRHAVWKFTNDEGSESHISRTCLPRRNIERSSKRGLSIEEGLQG